MGAEVAFSANLGFLWTGRPLITAMQSAASAGFARVEMHQPFHVAASEVGRAARDLGLEIVSLNTEVGDAANGELGLAALPGRQADARALIDQAIDYAAEVGCRFVSVVVGRTGRSELAEDTLRSNLAYGAARAASAQVGLLLEPLNTDIAEDLHLVHVADAVNTIEAVGAKNLFVMADTFHVMTMEGSLDVVDGYLEHIGHIQISGWPDRGEPDRGIEFLSWLPTLIDNGYTGAFGAEYTPRGDTDEGLGWLTAWGERNEV